MKIILNDHVEHLGDRGATVEVKPGFARNYLLPQGLAYEATAANLARFKQEQKRWEIKEANEKVGIELSFKRRAGEGDALYGSVTASDIAEALAERGIKIDRRRIALAQHIKRLGTFTAEIHLHREVRVPLMLHVEPEVEESEA
jgi:large subunit ribosomal protein L9